MNANDVIECYVTDVALQLPRRQRNDVAFELRALLHEGLQDRADAAGRDADAAMAIDFVNAFGRPTDVAARYRPALTIIDPADGRTFLRATVIGLAIIWCVGLLQHLWPAFESGTSTLAAVGQWWVSVAIPSLWWPGVLVVGFGMAAWIRQRRPQSSAWMPRDGGTGRGRRAALAMGIVGALCGVFVLLDPRWVLDVFWGGRAAPAAYDALTYTETFRHRQGPWLLALLLANVPLLAIVLVQGRLPLILQRLEFVLGLLTCAAMAWAILDGPIFMAPASDQATKAILALILVFTLIGYGVGLHRRVRPKPG